MTALTFVVTLIAVVTLITAATIANSRRHDVGRTSGVFAALPSARYRDLRVSHPRGAVMLPPVDSVDSRRPARFVGEDQRSVGLARRQFLNRSLLALFAVGLAGFGSATLAFLWQQTSGDFGSKLNVGSLTDIEAAIENGNGFHYVPAGKLWITAFPSSALKEAAAEYSFYSQVEPGLRAGVTALYQKCPHLGCRVPACESSQWFECPCHGSKFNRVGENKVGPAPRGLDRFPMTLNSAGELIVDTSSIIIGPAIGTNTTGQEAEGPSCVTTAD